MNEDALIKVLAWVLFAMWIWFVFFKKRNHQREHHHDDRYHDVAHHSEGHEDIGGIIELWERGYPAKGISNITGFSMLEILDVLETQGLIELETDFRLTRHNRKIYRPAHIY